MYLKQYAFKKANVDDDLLSKNKTLNKNLLKFDYLTNVLDSKMFKYISLLKNDNNNWYIARQLKKISSALFEFCNKI